MGAFARNAIDGVRIYFEDDGGDGAPIVVTGGFMDPIAATHVLPLVKDLAGTGRLVVVDHRGHGRSDRPLRSVDYVPQLRVADIVAVLDHLGIDRAHYVGFSWGARLGFTLAEHAPDQFASMVLIANQPYAWDTSWPMVQSFLANLAMIETEGMQALLRWNEQLLGHPMAEPERSWLLDNDPRSLSAAWHASLDEGVIASDFSRWRMPMLIVAGDRDDMHSAASQAATEIPAATFVSLKGQDHLTSCNESSLILPEIEKLWHSAGV